MATNEQIVAEIQNGINEQQNIEILLKQNEGMIYKVCSKYAKNDQGIEVDDLLQESALAIYEAVRNYDESKGASFINYFTYWQRLYLNRYVYRQDMINVKSMKEYVLKFHRFCDEYYKQFGASPSDEEASVYLQVKPEKVKQIREACYISQVRSLDYQFTNDKEDSYNLDVGADDANIEEVERRADNELLRSCLDRCISKLPPEQELAIRQKYLDGEKRFDSKKLSFLVQSGLKRIRYNHKDMNELRAYINWIDSRSYKVGYSSWLHGHGIEELAIKRLYADLKLERLEVM